MNARLDPSLLQERVSLIERLLAETPDPFEGEFDRAFVRDRDRILTEWQEPGDPAVLLDLVGRGPGTTPAGDDTLIGLLAGLDVLAAVAPLAPLAPGSSLQATRQMLHAGDSPPTSLLCTRLLESAVAGRFSLSLLNLQRALAGWEATRAEVSRDTGSSLLGGHTTGWSALPSLVAALLGRGGLRAPGVNCGAAGAEDLAIPPDSRGITRYPGFSLSVSASRKVT